MGSNLAIARNHTTLSTHELSTIKRPLQKLPSLTTNLIDYQPLPTSPRSTQSAVEDYEFDVTLDVVQRTLGNLDDVDVTVVVSKEQSPLYSGDVSILKEKTVTSIAIDGNNKPREFLNYIKLETKKKNGTKQEVVEIDHQIFFEKSEKLWSQSERQTLIRTGIKEFIVMKHIVVYPVYNRESNTINFMASPNAFCTYLDEEDSVSMESENDSPDNTNSSTFKLGYNPFSDISNRKTIHIVNKIQLMSFNNPYKKDLEFNITGLKNTVHGKSCVCSFKIPQRLNKASFIPTSRIQNSTSSELFQLTPKSNNEKTTPPQLIRKESKTTLNPIATTTITNTIRAVAAKAEEKILESTDSMSSWYETLNELTRSTPTNFVSDVHSLDSNISRDVIFLLMGLDYNSDVADNRMILSDSIEVLDCRGIVYIFLKYIFKRHVSVPFSVEDSRHPGVLREMVCVSKSLADSIHIIIMNFINYLKEQSCSKTKLTYKSDGTFERPLQEQVKLGAYKFVDVKNIGCTNTATISSQTKHEKNGNLEKEEQELMEQEKAIHYIASPENVVTICLGVSLYMCPKPNALKPQILSKSVEILQNNDITTISSIKPQLPLKEEDEDDLSLHF